MQIRISIVRDLSSVTLSSDGPLRLSWQGGEYRCDGHHLTLSWKTPGRVTYRVCVEAYGNPALPEGFEPVTAGTRLGDLDMRETWLCRTYGTEAEAQEARQRLLEQEIHAYVRRHLESSGTIEVAPGNQRPFEVPGPLRITPAAGVVTFHEIPYGAGFHWERREDEVYGGLFDVYADDRALLVVNETDLEHYLMVVNSSEMHPDAPLEVLKAQTVAARSTVLATRGKHHFGEPFDLCNTDHCQVYRGLQQVRESSRQAVEETRGEVLIYENTVADARYAKTCGGVLEAKEFVWGGRPLPYLVAKPDTDGTPAFEPPLNTEERARAFIDAHPEAFCNLKPNEIPYIGDPLYRWEIRYSSQELREIIRQKTGRDPGDLEAIVPLKRGASGRLYLLEVRGTAQTLRLFTELEIRRVLSPSHLPSSLFYVEREGEEWVFRGAGWGHGVGMCQVGMVKMAQKGYDYRAILAHYYPGTEVRRVSG